MKFIDPKSHIVSQIFTKRLEDVRSGKKKLQWIDSTFQDFDGTRYHIHSNKKDLKKLTLSVNIPYFKDLEGKNGDATAHLGEIYGDLVSETELDYDFTVNVDFGDEKDDDDANQKLIEELALVKRNAFAAPCLKGFKACDGGKKFSRLINLSDTSELGLSATQDTLQCIFALDIKSDNILTEMFFKEMVDTRKKPDMQGTPTVTYQTSKPNNMPKKSKHQGPFCTLSVGKKCYKGPREKSAIDLLVNFLPYVNYHLKCNKAHIHERMRNKLAELLKVMNRAKFKGKAKKKSRLAGKKKTTKTTGKKPAKGKKKPPPKGKGKKGPPPPPGGKGKGKKKSGKKKKK